MKRPLLTVMAALMLSVGTTWAGPDEESPYKEASAAFQRGDYSEWLRLIQPAALQGNAMAQWALGFTYESGKGLPQDYTEAVKWYRLAAMKGNCRAQGSLGDMYQGGARRPERLCSRVYVG
jgi:uncharacterized protein